MANERARQLRWEMTDAERLLWSRLRDKQLDGYRFRRQVLVGPYIADFACLDSRLLIELDGSQHVEDPGDALRTAWLESRGYRVIRFWNHEVFQETEGVLEAIYMAVSNPPGGSRRSRRTGGRPSQSHRPEVPSPPEGED